MTNTATRNFNVSAMSDEERKVYTKMRKHYNAKADKVIFRFAIILLIAILMTTAITHSLVKQDILVQVGTETVHVMKGDSLWSICNDYCPNELTMKNYIAIVQEMNDMDDVNLRSGEYIQVPIFESYNYYSN